MKAKEYSHFENKGLLHSKDTFSHSIYQFKGRNSFWLFKEYSSKNLSLGQKETIECEVLIQEFIRLIIPRQPKTRSLISSVNSGSPSGVLSKNIENFRSYKSINIISLIFKLLSGNITGLG